MSTKIIQGKQPLSSKSETSTDLSWEGDYTDFFAVDPKLRDELVSKGLEFKFIRSKKYLDDGGFHKQGYKPYKRDQSEKKDGNSFELGTDPEGYTRRGDLILAVKPKHLVEKDRAKIAARTKAYNDIATRNAEDREKIAKIVQDAGGKIGVNSGSDEADDD